MSCETCGAALEIASDLRGWYVCVRCRTALVDPDANVLDLRMQTVDGEARFALELTPAFREAYLLEGLLGTGGMGAVFRAVQRSIKRKVALKVLANVEDRNGLMRFHREARMLAALEHPAVVRVFDVGTVGSCPYLAMEWVRGGCLRDKMPEGETLAPEEMRALFVPVLAGLEYCHGRSIVHRDLKPENILIGEDGLPRIADFGLAAWRDFSTRITAASTFMGTPYYVAPEVATGEEASAASDLYAVGVMMFEALTGRLPFRGTLVEVVNQHISNPPPRLIDLRPDLPVELDRLMTRCLAKSPADRPARASVLAHELKRIDLAGRNAPELERGTAAIPQLDAAEVGSVTRPRPRLAAGDRAGRRPRPEAATAVMSAGLSNPHVRRLGGSLAVFVCLLAVVVAAVVTRPDAPASSASPSVTSASKEPVEPLPLRRAGARGFGSRLWVEPQPVTADISRDGQWMASRSGVRDVVRLWRAQTGRVVSELGTDSDPTGVVRFSPSGDMLGLLQMSGQLVTYRVADEPGEPRVVARPLPGTPAGRTAMALECSADGRWLGAVVDVDRVWITGTGLDARRLSPQVKAGPKTHVEVDATRRRVVCVDSDATFREWNIETGAMIREITIPGLGPATPWAWNGATNRLAFPVSGSGRYWQEVHLHHLGTDEPVVTFTPADGSIGSTVNSLRFSADGAWLITGCTSFAFRDRLEWWSLAASKPKQVDMHFGRRALDGVRVSSDGRHVVGMYRAAKLLVAARGAPEPLEILAHDVGHEGPIVALALEPGERGLDLVSAGYDLSLRSWDTVTRRPRPPNVTYSMITSGIRRCPCGKRLLVTDLSGGIKAVPFDDKTKHLKIPRGWQVLEPLGAPGACAHPLLMVDRDGAICRVEPGSPPAPAAPGQLIPDVAERGATPARVARKPGGGAWLVEVALETRGVFSDPPTALARRLWLPHDDWLSSSAVWLVAPPAKPVRVCRPQDGQLVAFHFGPGPDQVQLVLMPAVARGVSLSLVRRILRADGSILRDESLPALPCPPTAGAVSPDGKLVLIGGTDGDLRALGPANDWRVVASLVARAALLTFDSTASTVAVGTWDGSLATWPVRELAGW